MLSTSVPNSNAIWELGCYSSWGCFKFTGMYSGRQFCSAGLFQTHLSTLVVFPVMSTQACGSFYWFQPARLFTIQKYLELLLDFSPYSNQECYVTLRIVQLTHSTWKTGNISTITEDCPLHLAKWQIPTGSSSKSKVTYYCTTATILCMPLSCLPHFR